MLLQIFFHAIPDYRLCHHLYNYSVLLSRCITPSLRPQDVSTRQLPVRRAVPVLDLPRCVHEPFVHALRTQLLHGLHQQILGRIQGLTSLPSFSPWSFLSLPPFLLQTLFLSLTRVFLLLLIVLVWKLAENLGTFFCPDGLKRFLGFWKYPQNNGRSIWKPRKSYKNFNQMFNSFVIW